MISAIPNAWRTFLRETNFVDKHVDKINAIAGQGKVSKWVYHDMNQNINVKRRCIGV